MSDASDDKPKGSDGKAGDGGSSGGSGRSRNRRRGRNRNRAGSGGDGQKQDRSGQEKGQSDGDGNRGGSGGNKGGGNQGGNQGGGNKQGGGKNRRKRRRGRRRGNKRSSGVGFWGDVEKLPEPDTTVRITADPAAVPRSLGHPPLPGHERMAQNYFELVYTRATATAGAVAAAGGLIEPDELVEELRGDEDED